MGSLSALDSNMVVLVVMADSSTQTNGHKNDDMMQVGPMRVFPQDLGKRVVLRQRKQRSRGVPDHVIGLRAYH